MTAKTKSCVHGHPLTEANIYVEPKGKRVRCRVCLATKTKARYERERNPNSRRVPKRTAGERFWAKVDKSGGQEGCWIWTAYRDRYGYGRFSLPGGRLIAAHRWAYEGANGPIPDGLQIDHVCRTRACVRPSHMEAVTPAENTRRGLHGALQTHCKHGHSLSGDNLYIDRRGWRTCCECRRARDRKRWRKKKADQG